MGRKNKHIQLTLEQKAALEKGYKTGPSHNFRKKCHCILLNSQQWTVDSLEDFFGVDKQSIYDWLRRYETEGITGLKIRSGRGRKRKLDIDNSTHVELVKDGLAKENRSIRKLRQDLESKLGTTIGDTTLRDFLKVLVTDTADFDTASSPSRIQGRWVKK